VTNQEKTIAKRKLVTTSDNGLKTKKSKVDGNEVTNNELLEIERQRNILQIEMEERKMQLVERQTSNRRAQAEVEKLELENMKLRQELELYKN
jgi:hypothetical protein